MRAAAGDNTIGDFNKWQKIINHFGDCAGRERIMRFINIYMQETEGSITGLDATVKKYLSEQEGGGDFHEAQNRWWKI